MKKIVVFAAVLIVGCGTKKYTPQPKVSTDNQVGVYKPNDGLEAAKFNKSALYPLPPEPGKFLRFEIANTEDYIAQFSEMAQYEMKAFGIPASITLAQGILESGSGKGVLTKKTNNHFGIKCHRGWKGEYDFHDDDAKGECFRKYNHPMYSFRDHSIFLASRSRYRFLFNYRRDSYKKWAHGLKKAGYATDSKYPQKLIALIERYELYKYDEQVFEKGTDLLRKTKSYSVFTHEVKKGDTLFSISQQYYVPIDEIKRLNNLKGNTISVGQVLNLRKAKTK